MTLSDLRISHNITQKEIEKRTGIPYDTYRSYEYGRQFPKKDALIALAKLYHMSPGELLNLLIGWNNQVDVDTSAIGNIKNHYQNDYYERSNTLSKALKQTDREVLENFLMHYKLLLRRYERFKEINYPQNTDISVLTFLDMIVVQLRAICLESPNIEEKNYTAQRLLRMADRDDLAQEIEDMLDETFAEIIDISTREALKHLADKYICHYDAFIRRDIDWARIIEQNLRNPYEMVNLAHIMDVVTKCVNKGLGLPDGYGENLEEECQILSIDL